MYQIRKSFGAGAGDGTSISGLIASHQNMMIVTRIMMMKMPIMMMMTMDDDDDNG